MSSLDTIATIQKNGVIAINNLGQFLQGIYTLIRGTPVSPVAATTSTSTLYTVPAGNQFLLKDLEICNTTAVAATFTIYVVPSGGTAAQSNALFYSAPINGNTSVQWTGELSLSAGSTIQASASVTTVSFKVSGSAQ